MNILATTYKLKRKLFENRRANGGDRYDEVWDGVYVMSPLADSNHQRLAGRLGTILDIVLGLTGMAEVFPGINVSDREKGWKQNYRIPDVAVLFPGGRGRIAEALCVGGPDFVVEIMSRGDRSRQKRGFYAAIGVRELLIVDRRPWGIELYRLDEGKLNLVGKSTRDEPQILVSEVVPLRFRLIDEQGEPKIEVVHRDGEPVWVV